MAASIAAVSRNDLEQEIDASIFSRLLKGIGEADREQDTTFKTDSFPRTSYSFQEEQFIAGMQYNAPALDYVKLWYGGNKEKLAEYVSDIESAAESPTEGQSDMLTAKEAEEIFMEIQYSAMSGNIYQMNAQDLRKFNLSIIFDTALFKLRESLLGLTRNVNYWMM